MAVPDYQTYMTPMLQLLSDGLEHRITDVAARLAVHFGLSEEDQRDMIPSGRKSRHYDRVGWAASYMKQAALIFSPRRAWYQITQRGLDIVQAGYEVNTAYLEQFVEFQEFRARSRAANDVEDISTTPLAQQTQLQTPDEVIETAYQELRAALASELLDRLKEASPQFFEQAVIDLLLAMGYGGSSREAASRVGRTGDGGIDGIINEDQLGLDVVYIQAKRWQGTVGARDVRDFSGSLDERKSQKGVFITTSDFTREARDFVERTSKRIVLIDGQRLAQLMIDYNIGVTARKTYVIKRVDEDYFSEE